MIPEQDHQRIQQVTLTLRPDEIVIGNFRLIKDYNRSLWIEREADIVGERIKGEGGEFSEAALAKLIEQFYLANF